MRLKANANLITVLEDEAEELRESAREFREERPPGWVAANDPLYEEFKAVMNRIKNLKRSVPASTMVD